MTRRQLFAAIAALFFWRPQEGLECVKREKMHSGDLVCRSGEAVKSMRFSFTTFKGRKAVQFDAVLLCGALHRETCGCETAWLRAKWMRSVLERFFVWKQ